jgi:hypothetical protein
MGRRKPYRRTTGFIPRQERRFTARPVHRQVPDVEKLTQVVVRMALARVAEARAARAETARPQVLKPGPRNPVSPVSMPW